MDIAIDCFARYGYQATSIDRIAKAAGLTKGAIYYHYKDKEELLFEAVRNRVGQFERVVTSTLVPVTDPVQALTSLSRICIDHATTSNHRRFIVTLMVEALDTNVRLSAQFQKMMERFRAFLADIIEIGQKQKVFRTEVSAPIAAGVFAGTMMGAEIQFYQDPKGSDLEGTLDAFLESYLAWLKRPERRQPRRK